MSRIQVGNAYIQPVHMEERLGSSTCFTTLSAPGVASYSRRSASESYIVGCSAII